MDGLGLRRYLDGCDKDWNFIRVELVGSLRLAPDPGLLVMDALEGFGSLNLRGKRRCVALLEALVEVRPRNLVGVKARAKKFGLELKESVNLKGGEGVELLCFLNLVAGFGLVKEFDAGELVDCFVVIGESACAPWLCRMVGLGERDNVSVIEKLMRKEKQLAAVRFICELGLADKFNPVDTMIRYLRRLKKIRNKNCKEGKYTVYTKNKIRSKEIKAIELALRIIDEYKLQYPKVFLEERIKLLEKRQADDLRAPSPDKSFRVQNEPEKNQKPQLPVGNKRLRTSTPTGPVLQPIGFVASPLPLVGSLSTAGPNGLVDCVSAFASSSAGPCDLPGTSVGYQGNPNTPWRHHFPLEPYMPGETRTPIPAYVPPQPHMLPPSPIDQWPNSAPAFAPPRSHMPPQLHTAAQPQMPPPYGGYCVPNSHYPPYQPH